MKGELPDVQAGFRKGRETWDQIANIHWIKEKRKKNSRKTSTSASLTLLKPLTVWITTYCGKFWKRWEDQTTWPASCETFMQVRKQQSELGMEQQTGSKLGKERIVCILSPCLFNLYAEYIMWNAGLDKAQAGIKMPEETAITSDTQMISPKPQKSGEELKSFLMKVKKENAKAGLKVNIQKTKIMASCHITSQQTDRETMEKVTDFCFLGLQNHCGQLLQPWN